MARWSIPVPLHAFRPRLLDSLKGYGRQHLLRDLGAGLTVGVVALPLAMAFAIASGVKPEQGLFTAIIAGFLISALGGSQVQIGGPAGAFIVIVYGILERYGLANLLMATTLAGVILVLMGLFRLGALVRYIPVSIVIGFTNGIAVLIGLSQVKEFLGLTTPKLPGDFFALIGVLWAHAHTFNLHAVALASASLTIVILWPKTYKRDQFGAVLNVLTQIPGTVVALVAATAATYFLQLPVETIGSKFGGIPQSLPSLQMQTVSWESAKHLFIPTLTIALLCAIESLLCARVADNLTEVRRHDPNQELMAQGVANIVAPFFGGLPATGTIARTVTNVRSGAASPVAGMVHALVLLVIVLVGAPLARNIPLAALAGILMFVAWNMGEWREFLRLRQFNTTYRTILLGTFFLTVVFDLTVAVEAGLVLACLFFIYRMSSLFRVERLHLDGVPERVRVYRLYGSLFFGAVAKLEALEEAVPAGTEVVVLEMQRLVSMDTTGLDALAQLHKALERLGARLVLCDVNEQPLGLMARSGFDQRLGPGSVFADLSAALAGVLTPARSPQPGASA
ncbi:SulP family inorganic anion transporter [Aquabacterium sp.]|uniref:SulP family inorganic anion transporter n=1 Tax=Aquabacterium sp. TaxID=1872578 RepID=UPI0035B453D9